MWELIKNILKMRRLPDYRLNAHLFEYGNQLTEDRWKIRLISKHGRTYYRNWYSTDTHFFFSLKKTVRIEADYEEDSWYPKDQWIKLIECEADDISFQMQKSCYSTKDLHWEAQLALAKKYDRDVTRPNERKTNITLAYFWVKEDKVINRVTY